MAATVAMAWVSWWLVGLFALLTVRAAVLPGRRLAAKQVGIAEIFANVAVVVTALLVV